MKGLQEPCNVVLTHTNADFDSLASAVAVAKVWNLEHPEHPTHVVMPRGSNPLVSRFLAYHKHLLPLRGYATIQADDLQRVGVVDTQSRNRLGPAEKWLASASHIVVYDHHVEVNGDINPDELVLDDVGSLTTVLVEKLQQLDVALSEAEATLFALGIRADTGALSYAQTTPRDGEALVWLMRHGSSQSAIAEFGHARLSAVQRDILSEALHKTARLRHEGLSIGTVQLYTGRGFVTGMAAVAEELIALMSLDVMLLCVVHQNAKGQPFLSLIGRASSRASTVDLNEVMGRWGGGGHPAASACSLRLSEVEEVAVQGAEAEARARARAGAGAGAEGGAEAEDAEEAEARARDSALAKRALVEMEEAAYRYLAQGLQQVLAQLPAQKTAAELMTRRVFCVGPEMTMEEARRLMLKVNKKSTPVVDAEGKFEGTLKYNAVVKALKAGKAAQMVKAWMRREGVTVAPDTPFDDLERVMESEGAGRLPVVSDEGKLLGLVTRTDVLQERKLYASVGGTGQRRV